MTWQGREDDRDALLRTAAEIASGIAAGGREDWEQVIQDALFAARLLVAEVDKVGEERESGPPTLRFERKQGADDDAPE